MGKAFSRVGAWVLGPSGSAGPCSELPSRAFCQAQALLLTQLLPQENWNHTCRASCRATGCLAAGPQQRTFYGEHVGLCRGGCCQNIPELLPSEVPWGARLSS